MHALPCAACPQGHDRHDVTVRIVFLAKFFGEQISLPVTVHVHVLLATGHSPCSLCGAV